jgi:DMSO/TMAO reductase YedYZ molybdopterin-dependent catalytic subunit
MESRLYGSRWHGVLLGLLSTFAGLAVAELVVGLVRGASSPVLPVGQEIIDIVPPAVKDWAIAWFGTADKAVLILGTVFSLAVIGSVVGILAVRGNRPSAYAVTIVVGLTGMWAVTMRPDPTFGKVLPPIIGTIASIAVIWWLAPRTAALPTTARLDPVRDDAGDGDHVGDRVGDPANPAPVAGAGDRTDAGETVLAPVPAFTAPRRGFLQGAATVGILSVAAGALGRTLKGRFAVDDEIESLEIPDADDGALPVSNVAVDEASDGFVAGERDFGIEGVESWVVPNDDFYRIDTALAVPQVPRDSWRLRIHGMVDRELELSFDDVLARPMIERYITLSCVSNEVGGGLVGNALFQGIRLKDLLDEAGVQEGATQVVSRSIDGWDCGSPTSVIMDGRDAMLAIAMNGEPLPAEHGYPARLVVPGLYGYVSATKWVTDIELTRWEDFDGYWVPRGWAKEGPVKTMARIDRPRRGRRLDTDDAGVVDIAGLAWAVHRGIGRVEVSIDEGEWLECELAGVPSDDTWRQWRYRWEDATPGEHTVRARAYDADGVPQPEEPKGVAPDGAQGYHQVRFSVS